MSMNEIDRKGFKRDALSRISGYGGGARYKWYAERLDGDFDGSDGGVYTEAQVKARRRELTRVLIEDLGAVIPDSVPAPAAKSTKKER